MRAWPGEGCTSHMQALRAFQLLVATLTNTQRRLFWAYWSLTTMSEHPLHAESAWPCCKSSSLEVPVSGCMHRNCCFQHCLSVLADESLPHGTLQKPYIAHARNAAHFSPTHTPPLLQVHRKGKKIPNTQLRTETGPGHPIPPQGYPQPCSYRQLLAIFTAPHSCSDYAIAAVSQEKTWCFTDPICSFTPDPAKLDACASAVKHRLLVSLYTCTDASSDEEAFSHRKTHTPQHSEPLPGLICSLYYCHRRIVAMCSLTQISLQHF